MSWNVPSSLRLIVERRFSIGIFIPLAKELCHAEILSLAKKAETLAAVERHQPSGDGDSSRYRWRIHFPLELDRIQ